MSINAQADLFSAKQPQSWWEREPFTPPWRIGKPVKRFPRGTLSADEYVLEILRRAGRIVEGDKDYRSTQAVKVWFARVRACLGGRSWAEIYVPFTEQSKLRFIARMEAIERDENKID